MLLLADEVNDLLRFFNPNLATSSVILILEYTIPFLLTISLFCDILLLEPDWLVNGNRSLLMPNQSLVLFIFSCLLTKLSFYDILLLAGEVNDLLRFFNPNLVTSSVILILEYTVSFLLTILFLCDILLLEPDWLTNGNWSLLSFNQSLVLFIFSRLLTKLSFYDMLLLADEVNDLLRFFNPNSITSSAILIL